LKVFYLLVIYLFSCSDILMVYSPKAYPTGDCAVLIYLVRLCTRVRVDIRGYQAVFEQRDGRELRPLFFSRSSIFNAV
jgi:hypothetical protein